MIWLIYAVLAIISIIILLLLVKLHITLCYHHHQDDDSLTLRFRALGFTFYTLKVPEIKIDEESPSLVFKEEKQAGQTDGKESERKVTKNDLLEHMEKFQRLLGSIEGFHRIIKRFLGRVEVNRFEWRTRMGLGDAAWTGMAIGAIWAIKGNVIGLITHYMRLIKEPDLSVDPVWQADLSKTDLSCMISFRIGHAMRAGLQIVKYWKGREQKSQKEKSIQSRV
ncbi:MAG TPA: DUF2953 domain-containing protein [Bacillales bacterium]|nr:DUF2953 domain-containing protein [Bacillales bacterium]